MESKWFSAKEAAKYLNVSVNFLARNRLKKNPIDEIIPYSKIGHMIMYNIDVIDEFLQKNMNKKFSKEA
ncbi:MAG: helix-turn-helix domain-containing protein [Lachnospiraceae bacterium]|nr:helix-turn-helix domain-containing protein [Lachnospiraceae bacterium]